MIVIDWCSVKSRLSVQPAGVLKMQKGCLSDLADSATARDDRDKVWPHDVDELDAVAIAETPRFEHSEGACPSLLFAKSTERRLVSAMPA